LTSFWSKGDGAAIAGNEAYVAVQQQLIDLAGMLSVGTEGDVAAVLIGKWSHVGTGSDVRMAINEVLRQVRLLGDETFNYVPGTKVGHYKAFDAITPRVREALDSMEEAVEQWCPTDWITRSNERGNLGFYGKKSRASYVDTAHVDGASGHYTAVGDGLIDIGRTGSVPDQSTMLHEVWHRGQRASPLHEELERRWWQRRLDASPNPIDREIRPLVEIRPGWGYKESEKAATDEFLDAYIGKVYGDPATGRVSETSTMAMEHLAGLPGSRGHALAEDWDMVDWMVGMLTGI